MVMQGVQPRGVQYEWIDQENHPEGKQIGFIGQEAVNVIPEVVEEKDGYYSMQYAPITALLVEAVKEQQAQVEELKTYNEALVAENLLIITDFGEANKNNFMDTFL